MSNSASSGGIGCLTVIGIVFVVLKLVGVVDWGFALLLIGAVAFIVAAFTTDYRR